MAGNQSRVLEDCRVQLVKDLDPSEVMDYLISDGILVPDDQEKLESMKTRKEKVRYLLDLIPRRGERAVTSFMKALQDKDTGHYHLYELIQSKLQEPQPQPQPESSVQQQPHCVVQRQQPYAAAQHAELRAPTTCTEPNEKADFTDARPVLVSFPQESQCPGYDYTEHLRDTPRSPSLIPSDKLLSQLASKMGKDWENLAVRLGLNQGDIYKCKMESQYNMWGQINSALIKWRNKMYKQATVGRLVAELQSCDVGREVYEFLMNE